MLDPADAAQPSATRRQPAVLLYDGHCSVCHASAQAIERMDREHRRVRVVDFRASMQDADRAGIAASDLEAGLHLIHADGRVSAGPDAVRDALRALRLGGIAWTLGLPGVGPLFARFYDWFARNRLRWFRRTIPGAHRCDSDACPVDHTK